MLWQDNKANAGKSIDAFLNPEKGNVEVMTMSEAFSYDQYRWSFGTDTTADMLKVELR